MNTTTVSRTVKMKLLFASILCLCGLVLASALPGPLTDPCVLCLRQDLCYLKCEEVCSTYHGSVEQCWTCLSATEDCARRCESLCGHGGSLTPPPPSVPTVVPTREVETDLENVADLQPLLTPGSLDHSLGEKVERYLFPEYRRDEERTDMEHLVARLLHQSGLGLGHYREISHARDLTGCGQCLESVGDICSICRHPCVYTPETWQQCETCMTDFSCRRCEDICLGNGRLEGERDLRLVWEGDRRPDWEENKRLDWEGDRKVDWEWNRRLDWEGDRGLEWEGDRKVDWGEGDRKVDWEWNRRLDWEWNRRLDWEGDRRPHREGDRRPHWEGDRRVNWEEDWRRELYRNQLSWLNKVGCYTTENCDESGHLADVSLADLCCTLPSRDKTKPLYIRRQWDHHHVCYMWHCGP